MYNPSVGKSVHNLCENSLQIDSWKTVVFVNVLKEKENGIDLILYNLFFNRFLYKECYTSSYVPKEIKTFKFYLYDQKYSPVFTKIKFYAFLAF